MQAHVYRIFTIAVQYLKKSLGTSGGAIRAKKINNCNNQKPKQQRAETGQRRKAPRPQVGLVRKAQRDIDRKKEPFRAQTNDGWWTEINIKKKNKPKRWNAFLSVNRWCQSRRKETQESAVDVLQTQIQVRTSCPPEQKGENHILRANIDVNLVLQSTPASGSSLAVALTHLSFRRWHIINVYDLKFQEGPWRTSNSFYTQEDQSQRKEWGQSEDFCVEEDQSQDF